MGKQLRADIVIGGKADNSFYKLGSALGALGAQLNQLSQPLIEFGKESVKTYASYEDAMLDAQVALRTQYDSTHALGKAMETLDAAAMKWANDSRFNTQDIAGAISNAAHAGWDLQEIMNGVPEAMNISLAGSMSLAEGLEYLVDISNAAGIGFEDLGQLVDTWAYAANSSSTTIPEMGQAMQKMGATMQFVKGDMATLTTMLAVLADNGAKGTEAGTLLRNSMIRLIAPTKAATDALGSLGLSGEELDEAYSGAGNLEEVSQMLTEAGYSAYDANGKLKPFLNIFHELDAATAGMTEQDRNKVLSAIFPTRTITGALALLEAAENGWNGLNESIQRNSEGYAQYAAQTMESGTGGALRHLESVYNALQTKTGKALSEEVSWGVNAVSGLIERVNGMDDGSFNALVSGLEAVAVAGPALTVAGGAIKLIGLLAGTGLGGWAALLGTTVMAAAAGMQSLNEAAIAENFGELSLDAEKLGTYLDTLGNSFQKTKEEIDGHREAVSKAIQEYTTAGETLKGDLLTALLTKETLTADTKAGLNSLGERMYTELLDGIKGNHLGSEIFAKSLDDLSSVDDNAMIAQITETLNLEFESAIATAEGLGQRLREAMLSAFADGTLSADEVGGIQSIMDEMNALMAEQAEKEIWMEQQELIRDAQAMGLDGLEALTSRAEENRTRKWAEREKEFDNLQWDIEKAYNSGSINEDQYQTQIAFLKQKRTDARNAHNAEYGRFMMDLLTTTVQSSGLSGMWGGIEGLAEGYLNGEGVTANSLRWFKGAYDYSDREGMGRAIGTVMDALGGEDQVLGQIDYYKKSGNFAAADELSKLFVMNDIAQYIRGYAGNANNPYEFLEKDGNVIGIGQGLDIELNPKVDPETVAGQLGNVSIPVDIQQRQEGMGLADLESQGVEVAVYGDFTTLQATIQAEDGQTLTQYIDGDVTKLEADIMSQDGKTILAHVDGDTAALAAAISQFNGQTVTVGIAYAAISGGKEHGATAAGKFAEGGRADAASIFGEAGPEWAIPEAHTQRTAELLNAAREASGFTWPELLSRNGGMNAGAKSGYTLVYSPTIVASDSTGVEQKLVEDKKRLESWLKDKQLHDELEVYA